MESSSSLVLAVCQCQKNVGAPSPVPVLALVIVSASLGASLRCAQNALGMHSSVLSHVTEACCSHGHVQHDILGHMISHVTVVILVVSLLGPYKSAPCGHVLS